MLTCFFDFLTTPILTLLMGLIIILLMKEDRSLKSDMKEIIEYSLFWGVGYLGMWILKWSIVDMIYHIGAWKSAMEQLVYRIDGEHSKLGRFNKIDAIKYNFNWYNNSNIKYGGFSGLLITVILIIISTANLLKVLYKKVVINKEQYNLKRIYTTTKQRIMLAIPYMVIALIPTILYLTLANHSYYHAYYTYRNLLAFSLGINYVVTGTGNLSTIQYKKQK